jgi:hypothetical protein
MNLLLLRVRLPPKVDRHAQLLAMNGEYCQCMRCFAAALEEAGLMDESEVAERELRDGTCESYSSSDNDCAAD